jgi:hypothetical protein
MKRLKKRQCRPAPSLFTVSTGTPKPSDHTVAPVSPFVVVRRKSSTGGSPNVVAVAAASLPSASESRSAPRPVTARTTSAGGG